MQRVTWSRLTIIPAAIGMLALASCLQGVSDCPTCPGAKSGSIEVLVPQFGLLDSIHVQVDGGAQVTVKRNKRYAFENLSVGTHEVTLVRWLIENGGVTFRSSTLFIKLDRGETRTILFHNDFPLVAWAPASDTRARARLAPRMG
jgi:hypothetical protein